MIRLIAFLAMLLAGPNFAVAGGNTSGGGNRIESSFRLKSLELIYRVSIVPAAEKICGSPILSNALSSAKLRVVPALLNPQTGEPIREELDAWSIPGDIQLLNKSWEKFLPLDKTASDRSVDKLVLHELLRATGDVCGDDNFEKSSQIFALIEASPTRFSVVYELSQTFDDVENSRESSTGSEGDLWIRDGKMACTKKKGASGNTCFFINIFSETKAAVVSGKVKGDTFHLDKYAKAAQTRRLTKGEAAQILTLMSYASEQRPLYVVIDLQTGIWSYGMDVSNLIRLDPESP